MNCWSFCPSFERGIQRAGDVAHHNAHDAAQHAWDIRRILAYVDTAHHPRGRRGVDHDRGDVCAGSSTVMRRPPVSRGVRVRAPSCARVMVVTMAKPRPTPVWSAWMRSVPL